MDLGWRGIWPVELLGAYSEDKGKELLRRQAWRTEVHVSNIILDVAVVAWQICRFALPNKQRSFCVEAD